MHPVQLFNFHNTDTFSLSPSPTLALAFCLLLTVSAKLILFRWEKLSTFHHLSGRKWYKNNPFYIWFHDICKEEVYRLLLSRIASDGCQIIPFCSAEQDLPLKVIPSLLLPPPPRGRHTSLPPTLSRPSSVQKMRYTGLNFVLQARETETKN